MNGIAAIEQLSKKYSKSPSEFIKLGSTLAIKERMRALQIERFEILARYDVSSLEKLKIKIEENEVPEHPGWEDLIELENIEDEIKEIENDIRSLQKA